MGRATTKLLLELPPALAERLQEVCEAHGATKIGLIRKALAIYLRQLDVTESEQFFVQLSPAAADVVGAFREVRSYPSREKLVETALLAHIERELGEDVSLAARLEHARTARTRKRIHPIREARAESE